MIRLSVLMLVCIVRHGETKGTFPHLWIIKFPCVWGHVWDILLLIRFQERSSGTYAGRPEYVSQSGFVRRFVTRGFVLVDVPLCCFVHKPTR